MKSPLAGIVFNIHQSWSAPRVVAAMLETLRRHYGSTLNIARKKNSSASTEPW
jgi:hypothetical protein